MQSIFGNPLLLTLFLWIIRQNRMKLPLAIKDRRSVFEEVIRLLAAREMGKPSIGTRVDAERLRTAWQILAWRIYRARLEEGRVTFRQVIDTAGDSDRAVLQSADEAVVLGLAEVEPTSGILLGMLHEAILEYLVARHLAGATRSGQEPFPGFLDHVMRVEVNHYMCALWELEDDSAKREIVARFQQVLETPLTTDDRLASLRRCHAAYYIGRMPLKGTSDILRSLAGKESDVMVALSIAFGLVKLGDYGAEDSLWRRLGGDPDWDACNRGYHLVYYRDWSTRDNFPPYVDHCGKPWKRTWNALLGHICSSES
jgi:hypothetical protein